MSSRRGTALSGLLTLCACWAWSSLRGDLLPWREGSRVSPPTLGALLLGTVALVATVVALVKGTGRPRGRVLGMSAAVGVGLFVVPALVLELSGSWVDGPTRVALFSLTVVFAVVLEPYFGGASATEQRGALAAAMVAVTGTLLVFPVDLPRSIGEGLAFGAVLAAAATVAAANCVGVRIASERDGDFGIGFTAVAAGCAAICLAWLGFGLRRETTVPLDAWAVPDLAALILLFWLMQRMSAVRMTTRFLIAPLMANVVSIAWVRPVVRVQAWAGLVMIAAGAGWLLLAEPRERAAGSQLNLE